MSQDYRTLEANYHQTKSECHLLRLDHARLQNTHANLTAINRELHAEVERIHSKSRGPEAARLGALLERNGPKIVNASNRPSRAPTRLPRA